MTKASKQQSEAKAMTDKTLAPEQALDVWQHEIATIFEPLTWTMAGKALLQQAQTKAATTLQEAFTRGHANGFNAGVLVGTITAEAEVNLEASKVFVLISNAEDKEFIGAYSTLDKALGVQEGLLSASYITEAVIDETNKED